MVLRKNNSSVQSMSLSMRRSRADAEKTPSPRTCRAHAPPLPRRNENGRGAFFLTYFCSRESRSNTFLPAMSGQLTVSRPSVDRLLASLRELRDACQPKQEASEEPLIPARTMKDLDFLEKRVALFVSRGWSDHVLEGLAEVYEDVAASVTFILNFDLEEVSPARKRQVISEILVSPQMSI